MMKKILLVCILLISLAIEGGGQNQVSSPPLKFPSGMDIDTNINYNMQIPREGGKVPAFALPCDNTAVLLDVLSNLAEPALVKQEIEFEAKNNLGFDGIYKRRMNLIKTLAGKK